MDIRDVNQTDAKDITRIYNHFIANSYITFEEVDVSINEMSERITLHYETDLPWLVAVDDGVVIGYAYASKWKGRCAYRFSVEITVYIDVEHAGKGIGTALYQQLFSRLIAAQYRTVIAGISLPNAASVALHEKFGLTKAGHFNEVGFKFEKWVAVGYWQGNLAEMTCN